MLNQIAVAALAALAAGHPGTVRDTSFVVSPGTRLEGSTMDGDVIFDGPISPDGEYSLSTHDGDVWLSVAEGTSAAFEVNVHSGSVDASFPLSGAERESGGHAYRFETVNGGITLMLPEGAGADVEARTLNGSISTDFPLTVRGRFGPRSLQGTIGGGGPELGLETTNGSIELRRAG